MKKIFTLLSFSFAVILLISPLQFAQASYQNVNSLAYNSLTSLPTDGQIDSRFLSGNSKMGLNNMQESNLSLAMKPRGLSLDTRTAELQSSLPLEFEPWESEKHFWVGVGEIAILEFLPWAMAKWVRNWDDPADNWANVSSESWW